MTAMMKREARDFIGGARPISQTKCIPSNSFAETFDRHKRPPERNLLREGRGVY
jgi:hypothetical protein